jgi:hypothetical protein
MGDPLHAVVRADSRSRPSRHQTLRAAVLWSFELLADSTRKLFERLSVFAGNFNIAAVEAVCSSDNLDGGDLLVELGHLVNKSMVVAERREAGTRFRLLDTMRHFGAEQLELRGQPAEARTRHMRYYVALAERADVLVRGPRELDGRMIFEDIWDNLRAAHSWAVARADVDHAERIVRAARLFAQSRIQFEVYDWMKRTIELDTHDRHVHPEVYGGAAEWAEGAGPELDLQIKFLIRGIEVAESPDHPSTALCWVTIPKPIFLEQQPRFAELATWLRTFDYQRMLDTAVSGLNTDFDWWALVSSLEAAEPEGSYWSRRLTLLIDTASRVRAPSLSAFAALYQGHDHMDRRPPEARVAAAKYQEGLTIAREVQARQLEGDCFRAYVFATVYRRDDNRAATLICRDALTLFRETRRFDRLGQLLTSAALVLARASRLEAASVVLGHIRVHLEEFGFEYELGFRDEIMRLSDGESDREEWFARGASMSLDEAASYAIEHLT